MTEQEKIQSAKQELNQYYDLLRKGQNLKSNLEELRTRMQAIKVFAGGERVSGGQKRNLHRQMRGVRARNSGYNLGDVRAAKRD